MDLHNADVAELPSGTVALLFSDIEGSTALLARLGPRYADALDVHRRTLRAEWNAHGGVELGTEGDSFFVAFPTAPAAVAAAVEAQRALAAADWPDGTAVRVRVGIHTGAPVVHDGGYVGMDVHRAARIAAAAHGGQVVVSESTAALASGSLASGTRLRDLGRHRLKDLPVPERLYQVVIDGLADDFPVVRSVGAVSGLPRPATPLVGRGDAVARVVAMLSAAETRVITLTGPGGAGKTRLAIAAASLVGVDQPADGGVPGRALVQRFPDGVYFVGLSAVGTADVMWASVGEALDVPSEDRMPPRLLDHLAPWRAMLVLDNLEQVDGADAVVGRLVDAAPGVVVLGTSRRPLHLAGEREVAVPPLDLPPSAAADTKAALAAAERSGAVQLFLQHVRRWDPSFALTPDNAADVVAVCRRLDGLPLAIELAAARVKLLSPRALLPRLDRALDLPSMGTEGRPARQRTLRDTVAWSYDLLTPVEQAFFLRLGVFSGGADLAAVEAVCAEVLAGSEVHDVLDVVAALVDASLVTIGDDARGEPRVGMLGIVAAFARDKAAGADELDDTRRRHAEHYRTVAERLGTLIVGGAGQVGEARTVFELEQRNFREALAWTLRPDSEEPPRDRVQMGIALVGLLALSWRDGGYFVEAERWLERAKDLSDGTDSVELAECLLGLAEILRAQGSQQRSLDLAMQADGILRSLGQDGPRARALISVGEGAALTGDRVLARRSYADAQILARRHGQERELGTAMAGVGWVDGMEGRLEEALASKSAAAEIFERLGSVTRALKGRHNVACTLRDLGRTGEAYDVMRGLGEQILRLGDQEFVAAYAEDLAHVLVRLGDHEHAARLLGAVDTLRVKAAIPRPPLQTEEIATAERLALAAVTGDAWDREHERGAGMTVEDALREILPPR